MKILAFTRDQPPPMRIAALYCVSLHFSEASCLGVYLSFLQHWGKFALYFKEINKLIDKTETFAGLTRNKKCDGRVMRERAVISGRPDQWR